ncbi:MAG: hypothetical protein ACXAC7_12620 [Candidatus Hodarchaeales archaeon]|jgi:hypothetical protein
MEKTNNKDEWLNLLAKFRQSTSYVLNVDPSWIASNGWDTRDLYSHLMSWDLEYQRVLECKKNKEKGAKFEAAFKQQEGYSDDKKMEFLAVWNDKQVFEGRKNSLKLVKQNFLKNREQLLNHYEKLWSSNTGLSISSKTAFHLVNDLIEHDMDHAQKFKLIEK